MTDTLFDDPPRRSGRVLRLFPYYGGKWRLIAGMYPRPDHDRIVEPFAGSASYALHYPERDVELYDLDDHVAAVWRYLLAVDPAEIEALPLLDDGESLNDHPEIAPGARALIGYWLNPGSATPCLTPSSWMRRYIVTNPGSFWSPGVRARIAADVERIRHWQFYQKPYTAADGIATWFVDPPYQRAGYKYRHSSKALDFAALGDWCRSRQGQTIVCENTGATWLPFREIRDVATARSRRSDPTRTERSVEAIWTND